MKDTKDSSQMDIKKYLQVVNRRKYLFIIVSILVLSAIFWGSFFMTKVYEAKSTVFIEKGIIKNLVEGIVVTPSLEQSLRVLRYEMLSRSMLLKIVSALDLDAKVKNKDEIESIVKNFQKDTAITISGNDLFMVSYRGKDPKLVRDYVNILISKYIEENTSSKREGAFSANQFLSEQIKFYKMKIDESEQKLIDFRHEKGVYLAFDEGTLTTSLRAGMNEMEEIKAKIKELEAKRNKTKQQLSGEEPLTLAIVDKDSAGNPLPARLRALEQRIPLLLTRYTENYPEVIKTRGEIEIIKKQIEEQKQNPGSDAAGLSGNDLNSGTSMMNPVYQQLKEELFRSESDIDSLKAKSTALGVRLKKMESEMQNIPEEKKQLTDLDRERNTYEGIYSQLLKRLGQSEVSKQMEMEDKGTSFRIVDSAILPTRPVSPDRVIIILFGIAAGLAAGVGTVFAVEHFDSSIKEVDDLKEYLGLPVIAVIPKIVTEKDIEKTRRFDKKIYAGSAAYLLFIGGIFIKELIGKFSP